MGNNQNKYFNKNKRKVVIVGPEASGKTTLYRLMKGADEEEIQANYVPTDKFSNCQIKLLRDRSIELDLWDLQGSLPHHWGHYITDGVQGLIYVVENPEIDQYSGMSY